MINLVQKFLEITNYSNQKEAFEDLFQSHPNFPSLFAITDSLDLLSIENMAVNIPKEHFIELPDSFLAIFNKSLVLVSKTLTIVSTINEKGEKRNFSYTEFIKDWSGVVVVIEPNEIILNKKSSINLKLVQYVLPALVIIGSSFFYNNYTFYDYFLLLTTIVGLFFSILIIQEKLGYSNDMVSKFCNASSNTSCESIIKSSNGRINKWLSFSDLPVLFFSISLLSLVFEPKNSSVIIGFISVFSLPLIGYTLWIQKIQLKKWCVLCLIISSIILMQSLAWFFVIEPNTIETLSFPFIYFISSILVSSFWFTIKPFLEDKIKIGKSIKELTKFKRNYMIFDFLLQDIPSLKGFEDLKGLTFGNKEASLKLTLILSPSCGHCHIAFKNGFELVSKYPEKILLNILFNINPQNKDNPYTTVVESLLAINDINPNNMEEAITDWHLKQIGLKVWEQKWKVKSISNEVKEEIQKQYDWCLVNKFNYTPVKIVNNKLFPSEYEINELKYFFNDFDLEREFFHVANLGQEAGR